MKVRRFYKYLVDNGIPIELDVYEYAMAAIEQYVIFLIIFIPLSLYFDLIASSLFFMAFFIPLRKFLGGLHLKQKFSCLFFSIFVSLFISYVSSRMVIQNIYLALSTMLFLICIALLVNPTDNFNKKVSDAEKKVFKKKSVITLSLYSMLVILFYYFNLNTMVNLIIFTSTLCVLNNCVAKGSHFFGGTRF